MALPPFIVHVAGNPQTDHLQHCVACGVLLLDNRPWYEGRVAVPVGQENDGPGWWPAGALVATDKQPGQAGMTYVIEKDQPLSANEMPCT